MDDAGQVYPPRSWRDIEVYDMDEVVAGYREYKRDDPEPGPNRSPAYRWGWANRRRDTGEMDEFDGLRREYFRTCRVGIGTMGRAWGDGTSCGKKGKQHQKWSKNHREQQG